MRPIDVKLIENLVEQLFIKANYHLPEDIVKALQMAKLSESEHSAQNILSILIENAQIASSEKYPLCQDTGMAFIFIEIGQEVALVGGTLKTAIHNGVANAYKNGYLRKSVVIDPLNRKNTTTNLPPIIYTDIVDGDKIKLTVVPKGFGAENQSSIKMMTPSCSKEDIINFIVDGVIKSGSKGCPPAVLGIGIGGSFDYSAYLAKKALLLPVNESNPDPLYSEIEREIVTRINSSNIGPMGLGGKTTVLSARIIQHPTHIAGLPVAYNYCCHSARHASAEI